MIYPCHMSMHMSVHMSLHMSVHMSMHISVHISMHMSVHMFIRLSKRMSKRMFKVRCAHRTLAGVSMSTCMSTRMSTRMAIHVCVLQEAEWERHGLEFRFVQDGQVCIHVCIHMRRGSLFDMCILPPDQNSCRWGSEHPNFFRKIDKAMWNRFL